MKKTVSILLLVAMLSAAIMGCSNAAQQAGATASPVAPETTPVAGGLFTAGTYTGEAQGYGGVITMEVVVDESSIVSVNAVSHSETAGISDPAFERIPGAIVENQTLAVDTVAGCTLASQGIIDAVTAALSQAMDDLSSLQNAVGPTTAGENTEATADVIVIGTGAAGMSAALEILEAGKSVILIDKMAGTGGNTLVAGSAMNAPGSEIQQQVEMTDNEKDTIQRFIDMEPNDDMMASWQEALKTEYEAYQAAGATHLFDSPALHKLQTYVEGDYVANPALIDVYGDHALESYTWITELGAGWNPLITAAIGATWRRSHTPTQDLGAKGAAFVVPQENRVKELGGEFLLEHTAKELIMDNGRVTGVKGTKADGGAFTLYGTNGVVMATGGFAYNVEMRQRYNTFWPTLDESVPTTNTPCSMGDGIAMAEAVGANLVGMEWIQLVTMGQATLTASIENTISVNAQGNRFVREDGRRDEICDAVLKQTGGYYYVIYDAHTVEDLLNGVAYDGREIAPMIDNVHLAKGETLEELATTLSMPPENLQNAIDQFHEAFDNGNDPFGRTVFDYKLDKGPFYAVRQQPKVHHTMGGIEINTHCQALDTAGNVIPGFYAAGEVTGGIHGSNRLGGNAITDAITFGRIAGQSAAAGQ